MIRAQGLLLSATLWAAASVPAFAADPTTLVAAAHDWSGLYVGGQIGYGWGDATTAEINTPDGSLNVGPLDYEADGFIGGLHIGYNYQAGALVFGAEADAEYSGIDGLYDFENTNSLPKHIDWTGSLRGRLGYAFDRVLLYGTAGLAIASVKMEAVESNAVALSERETAVGWTVGAGAEFALTSNLSMRAEYRYADYGKTSISGDVYGGTFTYPHDNKVHAVRLGASIHF
jgi:outer membrane immunogenic protein